jgi:hypothetical protein
MNKKRLKINYNVDVEKLNFNLHYSKQFEYCVLGKYVIYHELGKDCYQVTLDNSVIDYTCDLSKWI